MDNNSNPTNPNNPPLVNPVVNSAPPPFPIDINTFPSSPQPSPVNTAPPVLNSVPVTPPTDYANTAQVPTSTPPYTEPLPPVPNINPPVPTPPPTPETNPFLSNFNPTPVPTPPTVDQIIPSPVPEQTMENGGGFPFGSIPTGGLSPQSTTPPMLPNMPPPEPQIEQPQAMQFVQPPQPMDTASVQAALDPSPTIPQTENAPTDLSHLIDQSQAPNANSAYNPTLSQQPETLIVPTGEAITVENTPSGSVPKWLIGLGIFLLIAVAAASAFFILGIGKKAPETSLPAVQTNQQPQLQAPPAAAPLPSAAPVTPSKSSESSSFGDLNNSATQSAQATSSGRVSATSLIKQRQAK